MNLFNIENTFATKKERGWTTIYVVIDLHRTIIKPSHTHVEFYPDAVDVVKWFNTRSDVKIILWSSSFHEEIDEFIKACDREGIHFDFINENPLEVNSNKADFSKKFYFNILLEDKSSFVGEYDWTLIARQIELATGEKVLMWNDEQINRLKFGVEKSVNSLNNLVIF